MIAAIDIGTSKVVAVLGRVTANKKIEVIEVATAKSRGVKRGVIYDIDEVVEIVEEVLDDLKQKTEEEVTSVFTNVTGDGLRVLEKHFSISVKNIVTSADIEELDNKNYHHAVGDDEKMVQFFPIYYRTDDKEEVQDPTGKSTRRLDAYYNVLIGRKQSIENLKTCLGHAKLNIKETMVGVIASADAVLTDEEKKEGVLLLDIGAGTTEMAIYVNGVLQHVKVIPFGGNSITNDIKICYDILQKQAEQLKVEFGESVAESISQEDNKDIAVQVNKKEKLIPLKDLSKIVGARMEEILDEVLTDLKEKRLHSKLKAGIVLTGGGATLKNLDALTHQKMGLKVRVGIPNSSADIALFSDLNTPRFSTCVGLLLRGVYHTKKAEKLQLKKEAKNESKGLFSAFKSFVNKNLNVGNDEF